jgi:hypothetical protein
MSSAPCPSCGSADVRRTDSGEARCNVCDALFRVDEAGVAQLLQPGRPASPKAAGGPKPAWVALGVLGLGLALGVLWTLRPVVDEQTEPSLAVNVPEKKHGVALTIDSLREGRTKDDHAFWLMTLHNDGARAIRNPAALVRLYDANNTAVGEVRANAWTDVLEPGEDVVVLAVDERPVRHTRSEVDVAEPTPAPRGAKTTALMLRTTSVAKEGDATVVHGEVTNNRDQAMRLSSVQVVGRTREGRPVAFGAGAPEDLTLVPGASTAFEVRVDDVRVDLPDVWTAYAVAKPDVAAVAPPDTDPK